MGWLRRGNDAHQSTSRSYGRTATRTRSRGLAIAEPLEPRFVLDSTVVFNEIMFNPAGDDAGKEWVEIHNQMAVDMDISLWRIDGAIEYDFPAGTVIPGHGYLVVASDPDAVEAQYGVSGVLGPFTGSLSNGGETLELYNNFNAPRTLPEPPPPPPANKLWSVDIQAVGGVIAQPNPTLKTGVEAVSGWGNVWNAFNVAGHTGTTNNPSLALVNSGGAATSVTFSVNGAISGWSDAGDALLNDYLFVGAGNSPATATWQITGLNPAKTYSLYPYGGTIRDVALTIDRMGDGTLANDTQTIVGGSGTLIAGVHPDAAGKIIGLVANGTGDAEGNWAGFQLLEVDPPPGGAPDIGHLPGGGLEGRRLMNSVAYGDGDAWPVEPDGSGASLAKISPDAGSAQAENWTFSNPVGGTPGARNFSDGRPTPLAQLTDASGNHRNATPVALGTVAGGFEGRAGSFDGATSYAQVPVDINPAANPQITFGAWVRSDTTGTMHAIIGNDDGAWDRGISIGDGVATLSAGNENIWNAFNVQGHDLVSMNPTMNLVDKTGAATGVNFTILGTVSGFSNPQNPAKALSNDYMFVNAGNAPNNNDWRISGLVAGRQYDFYAFGAVARDAAMRVDTNGDGSLNGETTRMAPIGGAVLFSNVAASATGQIVGNVGPGSGGEGNWAGFELVDRVTGQLISVDLQAVNGPLFGQQPPLLQNGPLTTAPGVGYSALAGSHELNGTGIVPNPEKWAFVTGVFNQTTNQMTLYVDADASTTADALQVFTDNATAFGSSTLPTNIGRLPSGSWYWDGLIDNAFFASGSLSAAQVTALRNGGSSAITALGGSLLAFYPFEDTVPGDTQIVLPSVAINEVASTTAATFAVELTNTGTRAINLGGMVLSTNEGSPDYVLPSQSLAPGGYVAINEAALGFRPADGDALFLYASGRTSVADAVHVDDTPRARLPNGTGAFFEPTTSTFGSANSVPLHDEVVINEIMYHGYPDRGQPATPAQYATTTLLDWNATWRYNQIGQSVAGGQLPVNWAATAHPANGSTWFSGPGIFALEPNGTIAPIGTALTLGGGRTTYYFETEFTVPVSAPADVEIQLEHYIDDGAIFYLNGVEITDRFNMPASGVTNATFSTTSIEAASATVTISADKLAAAGFQRGVPQRLSIEVHQGAAASTDVVFGTRVLTRALTAPGTPATPFVESDEEWIELYNRSAGVVDLTGWALHGGIDFDFPAGTTIPAGGYLVVSNNKAALIAKYPAIASKTIGDFSGQLANGGELVRLEDPLGNPADEVNYFDGGRWPSLPDGGGSSLELRNPDADNAQPAAWAASDESGDTAWKTYTYRGIATNDGIGNDAFHELVLGMLDAGEILIDNVSVTEKPGTAQAVQVIQNGSFDSDARGGAASKWRIIGNHSGTVIADPTNDGNNVLRLVATGATEDKHNHAETTFTANRAIAIGSEYEISFRAKWISGSNQLNSRLYFNFLQKTTLVDVSYNAGTPGAQNSRYAVNVGPTYTDFKHGPVVPKPGEAVTVSVMAADVDGIAVGSMTLFYSVNGGGFASAPMAAAGGGSYSATVPGQAAASVVQFYVQGTDALGAVSTYPARGAASRALYVVEDGQAAVGQLHNVHIIMTPADRDFLYLNTNRMSNDFLGATVIYDESEVFYDVGAQLKGSAFGRFAGTEQGFSIHFNPEQLFRGVHETISIERAGNKKEVLAKQMYGHAGGGLTSFYDDVIRVVAPRPSETGVALLSMARYSDVLLDESFDDGGQGALYNMELLYNPNGTVDGNPESLKLNNPYNHTNGTLVIADKGDDKETYRWNYQMRNARGRDDYGPLIELMKAFSLTGSALDAATQEIMDVDQWMRVWAMYSLNGNDDLYTRVFDHNYRMYVRPEDGKIIGMPWDLDRAFQIATNAPLWGDENLKKVIEIPTNMRLFYGHALDIINTTANVNYMTSWANTYGALIGQNFSGELAYIAARSSYVQSQLPAAFNFDITTAGPLNVGNATTAVLSGRAWVNVREIRVAGSSLPLNAVWAATAQGTSNAGPWADGWQITLPVDSSTGPVTLEAYDYQGNLVGMDTITITSTAPRPIVDQLRIVEIMYNPPGSGDGEEFLEVMNISSTPIPSLAGVHFSSGLDFTFGNGSLAAGERGVIVRDRAAFEAQYGAGINILGEYPDSALDNSGEELTLLDADGALVQQFTYDDTGDGWHPSTDGDGYSLVIIDPLAATATWNDGTSWRPSLAIGGSPGTEDSQQVAGDVNGDLSVDLTDLAILQSHLGTTSGAQRSDGDLNGDGAINRSDAALLARNFGRQAPAAAPAAGAQAIVQRVDREPTRHDETARLVARRASIRHNDAIPSPATVDEALASALPSESSMLRAARTSRVARR